MIRASVCSMLTGLRVYWPIESTLNVLEYWHRTKYLLGSMGGRSAAGDRPNSQTHQPPTLSSMSDVNRAVYLYRSTWRIYLPPCDHHIILLHYHHQSTIRYLYLRIVKLFYFLNLRHFHRIAISILIYRIFCFGQSQNFDVNLFGDLVMIYDGIKQPYVCWWKLVMVCVKMEWVKYSKITIRSNVTASLYINKATIAQLVWNIHLVTA